MKADENENPIFDADAIRSAEAVVPLPRGPHGKRGSTSSGGPYVAIRRPGARTSPQALLTVALLVGVGILAGVAGLIDGSDSPNPVAKAAALAELDKQFDGDLVSSTFRSGRADRRTSGEGKFRLIDAYQRPDRDEDDDYDDDERESHGRRMRNEDGDFIKAIRRGKRDLRRLRRMSEEFDDR